LCPAILLQAPTLTPALEDLSSPQESEQVTAPVSTRRLPISLSSIPMACFFLTQLDRLEFYDNINSSRLFTSFVANCCSAAGTIAFSIGFVALY
jgi:hypothetical protein